MSLSDLRREIDRIDNALADLLCRRAELARQIGEGKRAQQSAIHDPGREDAVLAHVSGLARDPLTAADMKRVFRAIIAICTRVQKHVRGRRT